MSIYRSSNLFKHYTNMRNLIALFYPSTKLKTTSLYNLFVPLVNNLELLVDILCLLSIINCIPSFMKLKVSINFFFFFDNIIPYNVQSVCKILVILVVYSLFLSSSVLLKEPHLGVSFEKSCMVQLVNGKKGA